MFQNRNNSVRTHRRLDVIVLMLAIALLLISPACTEDSSSNQPDDLANSGGASDTVNSPPTTPEALPEVDDCDELLQHVEDATVEQVLYYIYVVMHLGDALVERVGLPLNYFENTLQEDGVEKTDLWKVRGDYIYAIHNNDILIIKKSPVKGAEEVGRYVFEGRKPHVTDLLVSSDRLLTFTSILDSSGTGANKRRFLGTRITIINVQDPSTPELEQQIDIEGRYITARQIDDRIYLATHSGLAHKLDRTSPRVYGDLSMEIYNDLREQLPKTERDLNPERVEQLMNEARPIIRSKVQSHLRRFDITNILPRHRYLNDDGNMTDPEPLYDCSDLFNPHTPGRLGMTNLSQLTLGDEITLDSTGVLADGLQVYAFQDNLYLAMSRSSMSWGFPLYLDDTHIYKFKLAADQPRPRYHAYGEVEGRLLNRYSMNEYQGNLRVTTTTKQRQWNEVLESWQLIGSENLIVLNDHNGNLEEVGALTELIQDSSAYAIHFFGNKGYIVSLDTSAPFYMLDLSTPENPVRVGEIEVNGLSSYIYPVGDTHVLTISPGVDEADTDGIALQIFDLTDATNPVLSHRELVPTGVRAVESQALYNHQAFTYNMEGEVMTLPIRIRTDDEKFIGYFVYSMNPHSGFSKIGEIYHGDLTTQQWCTKVDERCVYQDEHARSWVTMRRSILLDNYIYSLSVLGLKIDDIDDLDAELTALFFEDN